MTAPRTAHPTTRDAAEWIDVYTHLEWLADVTTRREQRTTAVGHLEEIARTAAVVQRLDGWQGLNVHRAVLAGATLLDLAAAFGEPAAAVVDRYRRWSTGQRCVEVASFIAAEHDQVAVTLAEQLATSTED